jgi:hypothetical protein
MKPFKTLAPVDFMALCSDGPRIWLRSIHERYGEAIFREFTEEIVRYMNPVPPKTLADSLAFISQTREGMLEGADLACAILTRDAGEFLGVCGGQSAFAARAGGGVGGGLLQGDAAHRKQAGVNVALLREGWISGRG